MSIPAASIPLVMYSDGETQNDTVDSLFIRVEFARQSLASWPLPVPDFTTNAIDCGWITAAPKCTFRTSPEPGTIGVSSMSLEFTNQLITNPADSTTFTLWDWLRDVDTFAEDVHVRIALSTDEITWYCRFHGIAKMDSLEADVDDISEPQLWTLKFSVEDGVQQLERRSVAQFCDEKLTHAAYDARPLMKHITFPYGRTSPTVSAGSYTIGNLKVTTNGAQVWVIGLGIDPQWVDLRFFKLADIVQAVSDYMGLGTTVNDGGAWSLSRGNSTTTMARRTRLHSISSISCRRS